MFFIHKNEWLTKCKITLLGCSPTYLPVSIRYGKMPALNRLKLSVHIFAYLEVHNLHILLGPYWFCMSSVWEHVLGLLSKHHHDSL